jgi:hypothetical protein
MCRMMVLSFIHGLVLAIGALMLICLVLFVLPVFYVLLIAILGMLIAIFVRLGTRSRLL